MSSGGRAPEQDLLRRYERDHAAAADDGRDLTPAVGTRGEPGRWRRAAKGAAVALAGKGWSDSRWSFLYGRDTSYADRGAESGDQVARAARRMREGEKVPTAVQGPVMHPAVWTWEVPLYFWFGGIASGASFVALAADVAGDASAARTARQVALAGVIPCAPLLVMDLGRPMRFLHMLRIFKPRSPMSLGAWCLAAFSSTAAAAVGADLIGRRREAAVLGGATAVLGTYLGSYTGILLASTAVPVWARSRLFLPPIFVCTATATGAAATRLALAATGVQVGDPTRTALGTIETSAMAMELGLSSLNERRLGRLGLPLKHGRPGKLFRVAKWCVRAGLALRFARGRGGPRVHHGASVLYLLGGLAFRYAWVGAGRTSAGDDEAVASTARAKSSTVRQEEA